MIIKEQYTPPAARYAGLGENELPKVGDWTIMIKDTKGSKDGWYCLRCHAVAEKEYAFASLDNVKGFPGQPLTFDDDGSWQFASLADATHGARIPIATLQPGRQSDPDFPRLFLTTPGVPFDDVRRMPSETYDHVPMRMPNLARLTARTFRPTANGAGRRWAWPGAIRSFTRNSKANSPTPARSPRPPIRRRPRRFATPA